MDHGEAIRVLKRANEKFEFPVKWASTCGRSTNGISPRIREEAGHRDELPKAFKAFHMRVNDDGRTVAAMDVLAPGIGEIIGGSQREERLEVLDRSMAERGIDRSITLPPFPPPRAARPSGN